MVPNTRSKSFRKFSLSVLRKLQIYITKSLNFEDRTPKKKLFYYWSDRNENLWTYVKSKKGWGNCPVIFPVFSIENDLFKENWKKRESAVIRPAAELL